MKPARQSRRDFLAASGALAASACTGVSFAEEAKKLPKGKAEACIFLWLGGGCCHLDTWDPKRKGDGKKKAGSYYDPIATAIKGEQVCEHLKRMAPLLDRGVLVRSVHHEVIDEHAAATNRVHTGRPTTGTIVYPSLGSVVSHQRGSRNRAVPTYVVMGYPNLTRGPGFLGPKHGYLYLTETETGPNGLVRAADVSDSRQKRREALLKQLREDFARQNKGDEKIEAYAESLASGLRLAGPEFMSVFDLNKESAKVREGYGGEFGQRCLLARRLVEAGVRFIEVSFNLNFVNGTGWDTHNEGQKNQHILIDQLDQAMSALILDLEAKKLLDKTLIVVGTEFGRPAAFDGGGGRGHQSSAFSAVLAGGGLKTGQVIGETDELAKKIVKRPVSVPDLHATIYHALGIRHDKELYAGDRPVPITDGGKPIHELF